MSLGNKTRNQFLYHTKELATTYQEEFGSVSYVESMNMVVVVRTTNIHRNKRNPPHTHTHTKPPRLLATARNNSRDSISPQTKQTKRNL